LLKWLWIRRNFIVKNEENFYDAIKKILPENSFRYREISKGPKWFHSVMMSMTMLTKLKIHL